MDGGGVRECVVREEGERKSKKGGGSGRELRRVSAKTWALMCEGEREYKRVGVVGVGVGVRGTYDFFWNDSRYAPLWRGRWSAA